MKQHKITLRLKSLATGKIWDESQHVYALIEEQAIEIAKVRASKSHGRVIVLSVVKVEVTHRPSGHAV